MRNFQKPGRSAVFSENGMCATSHPLAAQSAINILQQGGNAMDAAIAGAVLLGFCEPQMTGLGGDCFVLFSPAGSDDIKALNGSGHAPQQASAAELRAQGHQTVPVASAHAVSVPGAVGAFCQLAQDWGALGLDQVLAPAIHYAEAGVPVAPRVALDWQKDQNRLQSDGLRFFLPEGAAPKAGQLFRAPGQADVLRRIAKDGAKAFYEGEVADDMLQTLRAMGGVHQAEDFISEKPDYTTPICGDYKGTELVEHPPNAQGATAILMLNMLSHFNLSGLDPFGAQRTHIEAEIAKLAYNARNRFIADPRHMAREDYLTDPKTATALAALVNPSSVIQAVDRITETVHKDTIYITVVDKDRMAVSLIYSIFNGFGSGIASEKFGILFQNRGAGFNLTPGHPNELGGGKRPMHTIIPGMLRQDQSMLMPFGVMGGQYQSNGHTRFVSNMIDFGMDPQTAIDGPRSFFENGTLNLETEYEPKTAAELTDLGHTVSWADAPIGGAQAITCHASGVLEGASDPRKDGCALGY